jgi:hypothetical protein
MMIANYNMKLAKLSLVQESKKGFPQGIPSIAMPYVESTGMDPNNFFQTQAQPEQFNADMGNAKFGGNLPFAQQGMETQIQEHIKRKAAEQEAYQKETSDYFNAASKDAMEYQANKELRNLYQKMQEKYKAGDIESKWYEMLPGVDPSAQSYLGTFKATAKKYGYDPSKLINQYDIESGKVKEPVKVVAPKAAEVKAASTNTVNPETVFNYKEGGSLPAYQEAGATGKRHGWYLEQGLYKLYNNDNLVKFQKENPKTGKAAAPKSGTVAKPAKSGDPSEMNIYTPTTEEWIKAQTAAGKKVILPKVVPPGSKRLPVQHGVKDKQNIFGKVTWSPEEQTDFKARHPWIFKEKPNWSPNSDDDVKWAQEQYTKMNPGYFNQKDAKGNIIPGTGIDSDFGAHTFSMPGIGDADAPAAEDKTGLVAKSPDAQKKVAAAALATAQQPGHDPWWLQDIVKTAGAAGDFFRVKKYAPWQATPGVTLPDPTFYDPTRELAANAEMANLGVQGANAFTNPQAYAAAFSQIQGQGAKNAADILGKYNQMNVGVANDFEIKRTDIMNQAAANRAGLSTQLADKYAIMNQQFDNSKNMARQNLRQSYIDAVTNKNYTGNLNDLYDQYKIDPIVGGRIKWTHGRPVTPEDTDQDMISKVNATALALRKQNPGLDPDKAVEHAIKLHSAGASGNKMYGQEAMGYPGGQGQGPGR